MFPSEPVNVLVVGGGGREHALCWKLSESNHVATVYCAPGNGGTASGARLQNVDIKVSESEKLAMFAIENDVQLVVIGPDNPLAEGIVDELSRHGLRVFGPTRKGARLESSKSFAKEFMVNHRIPTARYLRCDSYEQAVSAARANDWVRIVKADGLALGKGVFVCDSLAEVESALDTVLNKKTFGESGNSVVLEERLSGEEMSLLYFCDGKRLVPMPSTQDHKRRFDNDAGPNTGGMGAYAPVELYERCKERIEREVQLPIEKALQSGELDFRGVIYAGLMVAADLTPYVLEFNARFGDPETQALMPLLRSDLFEIFWACTEGALDRVKIEWEPSASCCVVAAAEQYPAGSSKGARITIDPPLPKGAIVFHAGTKCGADGVVSDGGRVLAVTAVAPDMEAAVELAYEAIRCVHFDGMAYRHDIARRAIKRCVSS